MKGNDLKERVGARAKQGMAEPGTSLAAPKDDITSSLAKLVPQFARAMPKHMHPDRLARIALTEWRRTPALAKCSPKSFFGALMQAAALGLEPGLIGHCYLVPFENRKSGEKEVQFIIGYKGMLDLIRRSGEVIGVPIVRIVYDNDLFENAFGIEEDTFRHVPWYCRDGVIEAGGIKGAYVVVRYKVGGANAYYMPISEIEKHRKRSRASGDGPWVTDYEAMVKKTVIRAHFAYMPVSIEFQRLATADEMVTRIDPAVTPEQADAVMEEIVTVDGEIVSRGTVAPPEAETQEEATGAPQKNLFAD
jgi:recombination protein RecT